MAAKKEESANLTHSLINSGDIVYDFCCTPCDKRKYNREATKYCVNCSEYFCVQCVESHQNFKALSCHALVDLKSAMPASSLTWTRYHAVPTELCKKHHLKLVDMYCEEEDVVGCAACFLLDHKSCSGIHYIPEYIRSRFPRERVHQINNELEYAIKVMRTLKNKHDNLNESLDKSTASCKQEIQKYRKEINHIIDEIEEATLTEIAARHKDTKEKLGDTNKKIQDLHKTMVRLKAEINSDKSSDSQKFVSAKLCQRIITQGQELQSELSHDRTSEQKFTRNVDITTFLSSIATLGMLSPAIMQETTISKDDVNGNHANQKKSVSPSASVNSKNKHVSVSQETAILIKQQKQGLNKIGDKSEYNLQQLNDRIICSMRSSCIVDSDILFADYNNDKLKLVDSKTYTLRSSLELDACPLSVYRVSRTEAAVCLSNRTIQYVATGGDKPVPIRLLKMKHECKCIAVIREKMYVCSGVSVYIYTFNGQLVQTINKDKSGIDIFSDIWDITVSDDENMIHVADTDKGVVTLNTDGYVVWRYSGTELCATRGLCTDGNGNVIVCGYRSHNVIQLSPDGDYMGEIVTLRDRVECPRTVSYDRNKHNLIIGQWNSKSITVYTVQ